MSFLVVDFEFSVYSRWAYGRPRAWFPEIIEVGAVVTDELGVPTDKTYSTFVKPRFYPRLTDECYSITGIKQSDIEQGITLEKALEQLKDMAPSEDTYLVAWGNADRKVLADVCEKYELTYPFIWENYIDLATSYRDFVQRKKLISLKDAVEATGIDKVGILHSAMDDAINAALVMEKMIAKGWDLCG